MNTKKESPIMRNHAIITKQISMYDTLIEKSKDASMCGKLRVERANLIVSQSIFAEKIEKLVKIEIDLMVKQVGGK